MRGGTQAQADPASARPRRNERRTFRAAAALHRAYVGSRFPATVAEHLRGLRARAGAPCAGLLRHVRCVRARSRTLRVLARDFFRGLGSAPSSRIPHSPAHARHRSLVQKPSQTIRRIRAPPPLRGLARAPKEPAGRCQIGFQGKLRASLRVKCSLRERGGASAPALRWIEPLTTASHLETQAG